LNGVDPELESAWFQPLNLKCDLLVSKFAFKFNLYRYATDVKLWALDRRTFLRIVSFATQRARRLHEGFFERVPILSTLTVRSGENSYLAFVCPHDMLLMLLVTVLLLLFRKAPPDVY
jgi:hypothetical protein